MVLKAMMTCKKKSLRQRQTTSWLRQVRHHESPRRPSTGPGGAIAALYGRQDGFGKTSSDARPDDIQLD